MQSDQINELAAALAKAQGEFGSVKKDKTAGKGEKGWSYHYADLASVLEAVRKPLSDNGLALIQKTRMNEGGFYLESTLVHSSGQHVSAHWPLPTGKPQDMGSALTYARRYTALGLLGIAAEDDDGASGPAVNMDKRRPAAKSVERRIEPRDQGRASERTSRSTPDAAVKDADSGGDEIIEGTILGMTNGIEQTTTPEDLEKWGRRYAKEITPENLGKSGYDRVRAAYAEQKKKLETPEIDPPWEEDEAGRQDDHVRTVLDAG